MSPQPQRSRQPDRRQNAPPSTYPSEPNKLPIPLLAFQAYDNYKREYVKCANPGLIFDRYVPYLGSEAGKEAKRKAFEEIIIPASKKADTLLLQNIIQRWQAIATQIHAETFALTTDWRFIPGLGRKGPLDVGFSFHRYGFPILPGSSVKGLARVWAFFQIVEQRKQTPEEKALAKKKDGSELAALEEILLADGDDEKDHKPFTYWQKQQVDTVQELATAFRKIFGTTAQAGGAIFLDAIPAKAPELQLDVMNPHFPKYYSGETEYPTDSQNPIPVFFLTVAAGQEFHFAVGWRGKREEDDKLRPQATNWLKAGLQNLGAGAKTSAGYGYFGE